MLTSRALPLLNLLMGEINLDPILRSFWEGFPCPPPWNTGLLNKVNWTGCVGANVGKNLKLFMVDKCRTDYGNEDATPIDDGERLIPQACATPCKIIIVLACILVMIVVVAGVIYFLLRKRTDKPSATSSPSHQTALNPHGDNKYYTSCHYASAPVVSRQVETTIRGNRLETRVLNGVDLYPDQHYHLSEPQSYGQMQRPDLHLPVSNSLSNYRKLAEGDYTPSSASQSNSDKSPIYEYIGDSDSVREDGRYRHSRDVTGFCDCEETGYGSSDTYYSDRGTQTFPIRHTRHEREREGQHGTPQESFDIDDSSMLRREHRGHRSRRRPGSGGGPAEGRNSYREGCQRRTIPALHPHYFSPPELPYR